MKSEPSYWSSGAGPPGGGTPHPMSRLGKEVAAMKRKCCNCKNSRCLKLYCECFAAGVYCDGCNCQNCLNNEANEMMRKEAIEATLERNPTAFRPKIAAAPRSGQMETKHNKGCHCKKSSCLKKYCECFQAGIYCSENCKCVDCKNVDPDGPGRGGSQSSQAGYPANAQYYSQSPARSSSSMRQTGCFFEPPSGSSRYDAYNQASPRYDVGAPSPGGRYDSQPLALTGPGQSIHAFSEPGVVNVVKRTRFDVATVPPRGQYDQSMGRPSSFDGRTGRSSDDVIRFGPPGHPMPVGARIPTLGPTTTPFSHPAHTPAQPAPDLHGLRNAIADIINEEMAVDVCSALLNVAGQEEERHHTNRGPRAAWSGHPQGTSVTASTANPRAAPAPSQPSASAVKHEPRSVDLDFPMAEPDTTPRANPSFASAHVDAPSPDGPLSDALACNEPSTPPWGTSEGPPAGPPRSSDHMSTANLAAESSFSPRQGQHVRQPGSQNRTFSPSAFFATPLRGKASRRQAQPQAPQEQRPVSPITAQLLCEEEPHAHHSGDDAGTSFSDSMLSQRQEMQEHAVLEQFTVCLTKIFDSARRKALAGQPFPLPSAGQQHPGIDSMLRPSPPVRPQNANLYSYAPVAASFGTSSPSPPQTDTFRRNCSR